MVVQCPVCKASAPTVVKSGDSWHRLSCRCGARWTLRMESLWKPGDPIPAGAKVGLVSLPVNGRVAIDVKRTDARLAAKKVDPSKLPTMEQLKELRRARG